jgi:hypothetical protein
MLSAHGNWLTHPAELIDFNDSRQPGERFGFDSPKALMKWFGPWLPKLMREGYAVVIYEVPASKVRWGRSGRQVIFQSKRAVRVDAKRKTR